MRIFTQLELENWAKKLGLPYNNWSHKPINTLYPKYQTLKDFTIDNHFVDNFNKINYRFTFSISNNNLDRFKNFTEQFLKEGFELVNNQNKIQIERLSTDDLNMLQSYLEVSHHRTYEVDFTRFSYNFSKVPTLPLVLFVQTILDAIEVIGTFWKFDESGNEICKITYPVGSIVSLKTDKSDFFIESVNFLRANTKDFAQLKTKFNIKEELILYNLLKILDNSNSQVIQFSDQVFTLSSEDIIPNRRQRLDELLG